MVWIVTTHYGGQIIRYAEFMFWTDAVCYHLEEQKKWEEVGGEVYLDTETRI